MSTKAKWFSGPPPSIGWWPASRCQNHHAYRWWDGLRWSMPVYQHACAAVAGMRAAKPSFCKDINRPIEWTHRPENWPKRSLT